MKKFPENHGERLRTGLCVFRRRGLRLAVIGGLCLVYLCAAALGDAGRRTVSGHVPAVTKFLSPIGRLPGTNQLRLAIWLPLRNRAALGNLVEQTYNPSSANYHQYLAPAEFTEQFGPAGSDYEAVADFATRNGLKVVGRHANRMLLDVAGSVSDIERSFQVVLRTYQHPTEPREFYAPNREPSVDAGLSVLFIDGLNNLATMQSALRHEHVIGSLSGPSGSGPGGSFLGGDFRRAYTPGVTLNGAGQFLGLLEFSAVETNDILFYEGLAGLPNVPVMNALLPGATAMPSTNEIAVDETVVDVEMAASMATGLAKVVVFVPSNAPAGLGNALSPYYGDLLNTMVSSNQIKQFSSSWGYVGDPTPNPGFDQVFAQMAVQGQSFFQASGDAGAWVNPIWVPAASPYVTCVGATTLTMSSNAASYVSETVWNAGNEANQWGPNLTYSWGSGGGVSPDYAIPGYQLGLNMTTNRGSTTLRNIPDVAMVGDNVWLIFRGGYAAAGSGTSIPTPLWAAFTALVNQQAASNGAPSVGFLNPALYAIGNGTNYTNCFHDVVTGNNTGQLSPTNYYAVRGFDLCTGWGSATGSNLISALAAPPDPLRIIPGIGFVSTGYVGGPFSISNRSLTLSNLSASSLSWSLANPSAWLQATPTNGSISAGRKATVTASLTGAVTNLAAGNYAVTVRFTNKSDGVVQGCMFMLEVSDPLAIAPGQGFYSTGYVGGPFSITNESLTLTNAGAGALLWSLSSTSLWLNISPGSGTLPSASQTNVAASLTAAAANLGPGNFFTTTTLTNQSDGFVHNATFALAVRPRPVPAFQSIRVTNGAVNLTWVTAPTLTYQLQYATDLAAGNWSNLGTAFTASNIIAAASDTPGLVADRFYRVVVLP